MAKIPNMTKYQETIQRIKNERHVELSIISILIALAQIGITIFDYVINTESNILRKGLFAASLIMAAIGLSAIFIKLYKKRLDKITSNKAAERIIHLDWLLIIMKYITLSGSIASTALLYSSYDTLEMADIITICVTSLLALLKVLDIVIFMRRQIRLQKQRQTKVAQKGKTKVVQKGKVVEMVKKQ